MIKLDAFKKGEKNGKTLGIFSPSRLTPYKETKLPGWQETYNLIRFFEDYVGYDKVYIMNWYDNETHYKKIHDKYPYVYNLNNIQKAINDIDDILQKPDGLVCFGGGLYPTYYYICLFINEKVKQNKKFDLYYYDHDPQFVMFNFVKPIERRLHQSLKPSKKFPQEIMDEYNNSFEFVNDYIDTNTIALYGGLDYETYANNQGGDLKNIHQWKYFDINEYSFANNFDFEKILSSSYNYPKKYNFGYFGIKRRNKARVDILNDLFSNLTNTIIIGSVCETINNSNDEKRFCCINSIPIPELYYFLNENIGASLFLTDKANWNNYKSFRFFENLLLDYVGFIYEKQDINKIYINNEELKSYIYVNENDFIQKVEEVNNDINLYKHLVWLERKEFYDQMSPYMNEKNKMIFENWLKSYK